jgi:hypothetical protein
MADETRQVSFRLSPEAVNALKVLADNEGLSKTKVIERLIFGGNRTEVTEKPSLRIKEHVERYNGNSAGNATQAFHLGDEVVKVGKNHYIKGEMPDVRFSDKVDMISVMAAFRSKARGRPYDASQEKYFELLTEEFKTLVSHG